MAKKLSEIHPSKILSEEFIKPMGITNARLAKDLEMPSSYVGQILNGHHPITVEFAMRLAVFFNMEARFWVNLQAEYDARLAETPLLPQI